MENSGGWKTYRKFGEKPLPKNVFGPPTYDTFSPPLFWRLSVSSLKRKRHRPDQRSPTPISEASRSGFGEHALQYVFPPPPKFTRYVLPPPQPLPNFVVAPRYLLWRHSWCQWLAVLHEPSVAHLFIFARQTCIFPGSPRNLWHVQTRSQRELKSTVC